MTRAGPGLVTSENARRGIFRGAFFLFRGVMLAWGLGAIHSAWASPDIMQWQTQAGSRVYFVEARELPIVDVRLLFDAGAVREPDDKYGLAQLVNGLLNQGAGELDATGVSYEFERLGARYGADSGYDFASVSLRSRSAPAVLEPALRNLRRVLAAPTFPAQAVARQKQRMQVGLERKRQSPAQIAREAYRSALYRAHPYARPSDGTEASIATLSRVDVVNFHREYYHANNVRLVIVGDLERNQAAALAEDLSAALPRGQPPGPLPAVAPLPRSEEIRIEHPSSQVHILVGQLGIKRGDADYFPLYVGNHILGGGGFVARLFQEIRERRGLSYGAYSYFAPRRELGPFTASLQTQGGQQEQAWQVLRAMLQTFIEQGPTEAELVAAKQNITGGFPLRLDSNSKILGLVAMIAFYDLPPDYLDTFIDEVSAVSVAQIRNAFQRHLHPERFVTVMVGPVSATD